MGIFGKSEAKPEPIPEKPSAPVPVPKPAAATAPPATTPAVARVSVIGARARLKGDITGDDDVVVEGTVEGQIRISRELRVAQGGRVLASVHAASVVVSGEVVGNCTASQRIELLATAKLTGDIRAPRIAIAEGAVFRGKSEMGRVEAPRQEKPAAAAP
ncbi:MAG TPA: polymer-forming cytoskeletal protein [Vicinamibacteria bacterium]|nr:polymer-forming cytoskeletal protein [Vicinamibacteria bacterium]